MAKCIYCHEKKGKRTCPALAGVICSACCGEFRVTVIHCPDDCMYLTYHEGYQRERTGNQFFHERTKVIQKVQTQWGRDGVGILNFLDTAAFAFFHGRPTAQDNEVLSGFQSFRQSLSPLKMPGSTLSAFGEFLRKELENWLKQNPMVKDTAAQVVEENIGFLKSFSDQSLHSNRYLKGLIGFMEVHFPDVARNLREMKSDSGKKIILPDSGTVVKEGKDR